VLQISQLPERFVKLVLTNTFPFETPSKPQRTSIASHHRPSGAQRPVSSSIIAGQHLSILSKPAKSRQMQPKGNTMSTVVVLAALIAISSQGEAFVSKRRPRRGVLGLVSPFDDGGTSKVCAYIRTKNLT
jgi:hypothetical protein